MQTLKTSFLLEEKRIRLHEIRANNMDRVILRSRWPSNETSRYFLGDGKRNYTIKIITKIKESSRYVRTTTNEILNS